MIIEALAKALADADERRGGPARHRRGRAATQGYEGVTGEHSFDEYGDTTNQVLTVYKVEGREWKDAFRDVRDLSQLAYCRVRSG